MAELSTDLQPPGSGGLRGGNVVDMNDLLREVVLLARALAGLIWPVSCAGCGLVDVAVCPSCAASMSGTPLLLAHGPVPIWGASAYESTAARLLVAWKRHGRRDLSRWLGRVLANAAAACVTEHQPVARSPGTAQVWLVPMPARRAALRQRGADLVGDLAQAAVLACHGELQGHSVQVARLLRHVRRVQDQVGLDAVARRRNVAGALALRGRAGTGHRGSLGGRKCIVVDDIVTTGASVHEAIRVLSAHGAQVVGVCCLSVTFMQQGVLNMPGRTSLPSWKAPSDP